MTGHSAWSDLAVILAYTIGHLATEISAMIDKDGMVLCWMSDFEDQVKTIEGAK